MEEELILESTSKGLWPRCVILCFLKLFSFLNVAAHFEQWKSFLLRCVFSCNRKKAFRVNFDRHLGHSYEFSCRWVILWRSRFSWFVKTPGHRSHFRGWKSCLVSSWSCVIMLCVKDRGHFSQCQRLLLNNFCTSCKRMGRNQLESICFKHRNQKSKSYK